MKRAKSLFEQITAYENIRLAWLKARKGKLKKPVIQKFALNVNENLLQVQKNLKSNPPVLSQYVQFKIFDPKERIISVVPFTDRVMHHAIMNVLEEVFERQFIFHTYACRKNKGTHRAVKYAFSKAKTSKYFLKLDVKKYFDNINHAVLKNQLERIIKDKDCLNLLFSIIDSYGLSGKGKGLPIGNLTSQFFANFYLSVLDHFVLENLKAKGYVRYMDDIVIFADSKEELKSNFFEIENFCQEKLKLQLKPLVIGLCKNGVSFLGFLINDKVVKLAHKTLKRKKHKQALINHEFLLGLINEEKYCERIKCMFAVSSVKMKLTLASHPKKNENLLYIYRL